MADENNSSIGWFLAGLGLGALVGVLFAPKSGAELRNQLSARAGDLADTASDVYQTAAERASDAQEAIGEPTSP